MNWTMIVAVADSGVIGKDNDLPWRLRDDLKFFKETTLGGALIMGRKNYESIGRPLPGRLNIVLSRQVGLKIPGVQVVTSLEQAHQLAVEDGKMPFVIGGAEIYQLALSAAKVIYRTRVLAHVSGDVFFPPLNEAEWDVEILSEHAVDERNEHPFRIEKLTRLMA